MIWYVLRMVDQQATLLRRLGAMCYDGILVLAILIIATMIYMACHHFEAIPPGARSFQIYLISLWVLFYTYFWTRGGQTAGMIAWRLKIVSTNHQPIKLTQALTRFLLSIPSLLFLGVGLIWAIFDKDSLTLYDRLSGTRLIVVPKGYNNK